MNAPPTSPTDPRAWIGEGPEQCDFCLQGYSVEVEVHCALCDRPGCPHCMVRLRKSRLLSCPRCAGDEGGD